ncbi:MAG: family 43 glycosylhydrolase [Treponema sp.]|nr:family 43 glycosylhydrolase [Treponema sp.]
MKNRGYNPYLPSWEYIPDGEPHVFDGRVYIYGSHDKFNGYVYCMNDYICWSASEDDLSDWRYEGVIFKKTDDPANPDGSMHLFAPDVTRGSDGKFYLYYAYDRMDIISVAVCDTPAGKYKFLGYVKHPNGELYGRKAGDYLQFDPGVLTEDGKTYLYTGQCWPGNDKVKSSTVVILDTDMLTIKDGPYPIIPGDCYSKGTGFENHEFFEASSIRKNGDTYYFIYSSIACNELCYATSKSPIKDFKYGGVIISNTDLHIDTYKPAKKAMKSNGNNHGSIEKIKDKWYVFYHRHTNGNEFSRQPCMEPIKILEDGTIPQVEMTSCGANNCLLPGKGTYPAYIACNLFSLEDKPALEEFSWPLHDPRLPYVTQDEQDGNDITEPAYITNIGDGYGIGFKYFNCKGITRVTVKTRGYNAGTFEVKTKWDAAPLGTINIEPSNLWEDFSSNISIPDGVQALYFTYKGKCRATIGSFTLE